MSAARLSMRPIRPSATREVWINEQYLSLEFACFKCIPGDGQAGARDEPPVGKGH
jgi:hypothetical protein